MVKKLLLIGEKKKKMRKRREEYPRTIIGTKGLMIKVLMCG